MESAELKSGFSSLYEVVCFSLATPALLTRRWMPLGSFSPISKARRFTSSFEVISAGALQYVSFSAFRIPKITKTD